MMAQHSLFAGLVVDEDDNAVDAVFVGGDLFYVVDDGGFLRHIESEYVDRQVLDHLQEMVKGHEDMISEGTMKMIGQEDIFTKAAIETSLQNMDSQFDALIQSGLPEDMRTYLGMMGFRVVINLHGEVLRIEQPGAGLDPGEEY
ncbi:MAG: hypothetical protein MUO58_16920 [Anaerolineales bacterium]|jgi:hypothetical protein|nr:hypothetical protein [Anaerolineales bacterium]